MSVIAFCGQGLNQMFLPDKGRFAFTYYAGGGPLDSNPRLGCKYTLNTLLGLSRTNRANGAFLYGLSGIYQRTCEELKNLRPEPTDIAMAVWSGFEGEFPVPSWVVQWFNDALPKFHAWHAQDLAWSLLAICAAHEKNETKWDAMAGKIASHLIDELQNPQTGLYYFQKGRGRHSFSSFAVPVYVNLALAEFSKAYKNQRAADAAKKGIQAMLALQHPQTAGWAWFHNVETGSIMDWYEFYSVHQDSMGPMALLRGMELDVPEARAALVKGFQWIFGENELKAPTVDREGKIIYRSFRRKNTVGERPARLLRAYWHHFMNSSAEPAHPSRLEINPECRSYELGWVLWTFANRHDFPELTNHEQFRLDQRPHREAAPASPAVRIYNGDRGQSKNLDDE